MRKFVFVLLLVAFIAATAYGLRLYDFETVFGNGALI